MPELNPVSLLDDAIAGLNDKLYLYRLALDKEPRNSSKRRAYWHLFQKVDQAQLKLAAARNYLLEQGGVQ